MNIILAIFLMIVAAGIGFIIGGVMNYSAGWDDGYMYTLNTYDKNLYAYEKKVRLAKRYRRIL